METCISVDITATGADPRLFQVVMPFSAGSTVNTIATDPANGAGTCGPVTEFLGSKANTTLSGAMAATSTTTTLSAAINHATAPASTTLSAAINHTTVPATTTLAAAINHATVPGTTTIPFGDGITAGSGTVGSY